MEFADIIMKYEIMCVNMINFIYLSKGLNFIKKAAFFCFLISGFFAQGETKEQVHSEDFLSKYDNLPAEIETANLRLKTGFSVYFFSDSQFLKRPLLKIPLLLELKGPLGIKNINTKWLISTEVGLMRIPYSAQVCEPHPFDTPFFRNARKRHQKIQEEIEDRFDTPFFRNARKRQQEIEEEFEKIEDRFDSPFFRDHTKEVSERFKEKNYSPTCEESWKAKYPLYFLIQPGLMHNFGSFALLLRGGGFIRFDEPKKIGAVADLSITFHDFWDIGIKALYYDDFYIGINATIGFSLKKWSIKNPYK